MKTGVATIPLDYGKCPPWLFKRIKTLGGIMAELMIEEFGVDEFLKRLSHPAWFQSFGSLLAFDWNSSGLSVVLTAALKASFKERNLGVYVAGGKGKTSRKTPDELLIIGEKIGLNGAKYAQISKLVAKIDNSLIQDGFSLYHHTFFVTEKGNWAVIQQGMNTGSSKARRYHWLSHGLPRINKSHGLTRMDMNHGFTQINKSHGLTRMDMNHGFTQINKSHGLTRINKTTD
ncbi:MAG: hypothetical protein KatS3mg096_409 [Candidatus Parcubacteria bacterium]|nr:MAG: hypothetical protein KatS3mg096_409 [Candidatus Parcubacteria bacterium]